MLGAFYFISIGRAAVSGVCLIKNSASNVESVIWKIGIMFISSIGTDLLRFLWISIFIERYVATIYCKNYEYEKKKFIFLPILLTSVALFFTLLFAVSR